MSEKDKTVETSLLAKTKALRDEIKKEVEQIDDRLTIVETDIGAITMERDELRARQRQLSPWLTRVENDLTKLQPEDKPIAQSEETAKPIKEKPTTEKRTLTVTRVEEPTKDKKKETEVKNEQ